MVVALAAATISHLIIVLIGPIPFLCGWQLHNHNVLPQPFRILRGEMLVGHHLEFVAANDHGHLVHIDSVPVLITYALAQRHHLGAGLEKNLVIQHLLLIPFIKQYRLVGSTLELSQARDGTAQTLTTDYQGVLLAE